MRWISYQHMDESVERAQIAEATAQGFNSGRQFFDYLRDAFDVLYAEGETVQASGARTNIQFPMPRQSVANFSYR